jgi:hypothetical protein
MQLPEFEDQFRRLRLVYGDKSFPVEREKLFFQRYKHLTGAGFKAAVDNVVLTMPIPSLVLGVIDEFSARSKPRIAGQVYDAPESYSCPPCRDFGYGWIGETVVRCTCRLGETVSEAEINRVKASYKKGHEMMLARKGIFAKIGQAPGRSA